MHNGQHEPVALRQQQLAFAAAIRHPQKQHVIKGVTADRMAIYRDLFFNNFIDTLSSAFPVLHKVMPSEQWHTLCEQFFAHYPCRTPYLARLPQELLMYLQHNPVTDPPWFMELAQWEWTELDLFLAPDVNVVPTGDDVMNHVPTLSLWRASIILLMRYTTSVSIIYPLHLQNRLCIYWPGVNRMMISALCSSMH